MCLCVYVLKCAGVFVRRLLRGCIYIHAVYIFVCVCLCVSICVCVHIFQNVQVPSSGDFYADVFMYT